MAKALKPQQLSFLCLACANMSNPATRHLATVVEGWENLQRLDISKTYLGDDRMQQLAPALGKSKTLQSLDFTWCYLGKDGAQWLPGIFQPALRILKLSHNEVRTHTGAVAACCVHLAEHACCFADPSYYCAQLNCASAKVLAEGLGKCLGLCELHLNSNNIKAPGAASLAKALAHCQDLSTLDLSYNELGSQGAESLAGGLRGCTRLEHLDLSKIHTGTRGLSALGELLEHSSALLYLGLRGNGKHLDSQMHAVRASGQRGHLMHLDLARSPSAAAMFQQVMADHAPTLKHLDLEWARMGFSGAFALATALQSCGKLEHLNLSHNDQLNDDAVRKLAAGIANCTALRELYLASCNVQPGGCAALAQGLKQCTELITLNLQDNKFAAGGAFSLALALPDYAALANLNLSGNDIRSSATTIASVLTRCPALVHVHLHNCKVKADHRARLLQAAVACPKLSLHL
jgi:Ran GTPase-activating protein (RanGAP) involved in mRNA processing and transport